ncbi:hypothetical protein LWI29_010846 [Acer saccharum]|uniref:PPM-type phosphatase domain-containing protein n=1 Tax=Acer saccharum TaxID=4024 RepID=A0AA39SPG4_ACESA|nr:hypothetical protein LWI29_010846 [Acer saccharum]
MLNSTDELAKDAKNSELMLKSSGIVKSNKFDNFASEFGCQEDMVFCGIFDGHGPWGHVVAKRVRKSVPSSLLCTWQEALTSSTTSVGMDADGENLTVANVGDSRAVLATLSDDGSLVPLQLTIDFRVNLPEEAEQIKQSKGLVFCLHGEPGVYRVWMPNGEMPGLAISRAFGDYCVKDCGLIYVPHVTQRSITSGDQFVILASDGVLDV